MKNRILACSLILSVLAACTLAPKESGRAYMFALQQVKVVKQQTTDASLTVPLPTVAPELDTYRIALIRDGKVWDYYAAARWAEFLPVVVQDRALKTLEQSGLFTSVVSDQAGVLSTQVLKIEIHSFQAEYDADHVAPTIKVAITVNLQSRLDRRVLSSFDIAAEKRAERDSLPAIQTAFQSAFADAQKQLVRKLHQKQL